MTKQVSELDEGAELSLFRNNTEFEWMGEKFEVRNGTIEFADDMSFLSMQVIDGSTLVGIATSFRGQKAYICRKENKKEDYRIVSLRDFDEELSEKFRNGEVSSNNLLEEIEF